MPCVPIFDPPWVPVNAGTVPDAISEDQSVGFCGLLHQNFAAIRQNDHAQILHKIFSCFPPFIAFSAPYTFQKSFSARAVSRSHQRAEHILKNMQQEEEKRRLGREASIITAIPIAQEACYEPTCSPPPEQEEEGVSFLCCTS